MKEREFFRQLSQELNELVPPLSKELKEAPIRRREASLEAAKAEEGLPTRVSAAARCRQFFRKNGMRIAGVAASVLLLCAIVLPIVFSTEPNAPTYIVMRTDINPSVSVLLNKEYKVERISGNNRDGDMLLQDTEFTAKLMGADAKEAAVLLAEQAAMTGFIRTENFGDAKDYNAVRVTFTADGDIAEGLLEDVESEISEYFCEKGVYVYAHCEDAGESTDIAADFSETMYSYEQLSASELEQYAKQSAYGYAEELLADAFMRYDLYESAYALNDEIRSLTGGADYWETTPGSGETAGLCAEMAQVLAKFEVLYSLQYESYAEFLVDYAVYQGGILLADVEKLRDLLQEGINEDNFGGIANLGTRLNYYEFVANDLLHTILEELLSGETETIDQLVTDITSLTQMRLEARFSRFSALFGLFREPIGEEAYADFLVRIGKA